MTFSENKGLNALCGKYVTYNDSKILRGEVFGFLAANTKQLKSKFSKSVPFQRLDTVPNHTI